MSRASTIDIRDLQRFSALSKEWWDLEGEFKMLHTMNRLRVPFIRDRLEKKPDAQFHTPLQGLRLLDVGSGGGLLSEVGFNCLIGDDKNNNGKEDNEV